MVTCMLLSIHCFVCVCVCVCVLFKCLFCCAVLCVVSGLKIISLGRGWTGCFALVPFDVMWIGVLCLFLAVPWGCLQGVMVAFPGHTYLLFLKKNDSSRKSYLLDPIHNLSLRLALGVFRTSPDASRLYVEAEEPSLSSRRE